MKSNALLSPTEISDLRLQAQQLLGSENPAHKLDSRDAGWLPTSANGSGMDYAESRAYQQGDDPRSINWRLSARSTETYVKTYHMEARPSVCVVLDQRRTMVFGTKTRLKISQALRLAIIIASIAEQQRLTFNVVLMNKEVNWLGEQSLASFLQIANNAELPDEIVSQPTLETPFNQHSQQLDSYFTRYLDRGSLVYLISDFMDLSSTANAINNLAQLQQNYSVQALHIIDQAEQSLSQTKSKIKAQTSSICLQDMKSKATLSLKGDNQKEDLQDIADKHFATVKHTILKSGVTYSAIFAHENTVYSHINFASGH